MDQKKKEIIVLSEKEHIRTRSHIYTGPVKPIEEKIPIIENDKIIFSTQNISIGLYKIFNEILDNSLDEAKRMKGSMKSISVYIETDTNKVIIRDTGNGFYNGVGINEKTGRSNIETAVSMLRSGSNFNSEDTEDSLIGNNGVGSALCNCLSDFFKIITVNDSHYYEQVWNDFERTEPICRKKSKSDKLGTEVSFIPLKKLFSGCKWDYNILRTTLIFKKRLVSRDQTIKNLDISLYWDGVKVNLSCDLFPANSFYIETPIGELVIYEKFENSGSVSFVNSAMCTGIHQKIVNDYINERLEDNLGHHFYDTFISLNIPPRFVKFGDQNKTKFVTPKDEILPIISKSFFGKIEKFFKSEVFKNIKKEVDARKKDAELKKIRRDKKTVKVKHSNKYFPSTSSRAETLFIVEGLSAMGSILQKRDPKKEAVYALKGKIKNARSLSDLADNREILELMQILNLDPEGENIPCPFDRVVIATDQDPDGAHITSLLINLFYLWFPWMIRQGRIQFLETPLVSVGDRNKEYFYSLEEFKKGSGKSAKTNVRYLKGLGSLSLDDWDYVMSNKKITILSEDKKTKYHLEMAFGKSSLERKKWLSPSE